VDAYSKLQDAVQSGISGVRDAALSPLEAVSGFMQANRGESRDMQELRERLAELETRVNKPKRPRRRVKR
jgi:hypothetical protein